MSSGEPIEKGQTIRYPSTALLCVNSENAEKFDANGFRIDATTPADIYINKQQPLLFGYLTRIALTEMNIQWAFPNVYNDAPNGSGSNNTLTLGVYNASGVFQAYTRVSVAAGFYSAGLLGKVLQEALNANTTLTATLGANTFTVLSGGLGTLKATDPLFAGQTKVAPTTSFTINTSGTGFFQIMPYTFRVPGLSPLSDDLTNMMGLTPGRLQGLPYYTTFTGGYASMMRTPYIDVVSNTLTANQNVRDNDSTQRGQDSILARIYLANEDAVAREITITYSSDEPYEAVAWTDNAIGVKETAFRREFKFPKQIQWNTTENIDFIDLRVVDYRANVLLYQPTIVIAGNTVEQSNTSDLQFTLMATEV